MNNAGTVRSSPGGSRGAAGGNTAGQPPAIDIGGLTKIYPGGSRGGVITMAIRHVSIPASPAILLPLAAMAIGIVGLALLLTGLTLVFKRIEVLTETAMALPFLVSGAFVPLSHLPGWITPLSRLLVPITPGIEAMRGILLQHRSLASLPGWGLGWLLAQPVLLVTLGVVLFRLLERVAMRRGTLGSY